VGRVRQKGLASDVLAFSESCNKLAEVRSGSGRCLSVGSSFLFADWSGLVT
jgi:hypothetical protein